MTYTITYYSEKVQAAVLELPAGLRADILPRPTEWSCMVPTLVSHTASRLVMVYWSCA